MKHNNILIEERKVIFFLVAKAANSSIKAVLKKYLGKRIKPDTLHKDWIRPGPCEARQKWDYYKIAIVRNPWERLVSTYAQKIIGTGKSRLFEHGCWWGMNFSDFIQVVCSQPDCTEAHIRDQTLSMMCGGEFVPKWIIDMHQLDRQWPRLQEIIKGLPDLTKRNTSKHRPYQEYYTSRLKDMVAKRYAQDIQELGYEF